MKQLIGIAIFIILVVSVYYDLTEGTLPDHSISEQNIEHADENQDAADQQEGTTLVYQEVIVESGHTVYTIVQALHQDQTIDAGFDQIADDFELLNPEVSAHEIQVGQTYRFPLYIDVQNTPES
ncbi:hypothetical protein [Alteribacter populi]|uniref:hypothetical protein n=1 Tax=Alteribacter populi TaxID=2011011 RepID=UPI000BBAB105|nr:hypothetical protein [Alteribacter populi]